MLWLLPSLAAAIGLPLLLDQWLSDRRLAFLISAAVALPLVMLAVRRALVPMNSLFRALSGSVNSYRDGEYNFGIHWDSADELGDLVRSHSELGDVLREQRQSLVQRELLLDTMVQNTPVAMLLLASGSDDSRRVVFANVAARKLLHGGWKLEGQNFDSLLQAAPLEMREAMARGGDSLFAVGHEDNDEEEQVYHLARRNFRLNGRRHELLLLRLLTSELRRQEVNTWKKVIRVISHELNNSLAPVASLAHSGNWCGAGDMNAWRRFSPPLKNAHAIWKALSAATRALPNCRNRSCRRCAGRPSWPACSGRSDLILTCLATS